MKVQIKNINVSQPSGSYSGGLLHVGFNSMNFSVKYLVMSKVLWGFGVSSLNNVRQDAHNIGFTNCTGNGALIMTYTVEFHISNFHTFECNNKLWHPCAGGSLVIHECWIKGVNTEGVSFEGTRYHNDSFFTLPFKVNYMYAKYNTKKERAGNNFLTLIFLIQ